MNGIRQLFLGPFWMSLLFFLLFAGPFLFESRSALINMLDVLYTVPGLILFSGRVRAVWTQLRPASMFIALFSAWCALSAFWSDSPNISRVVRASLELVAMALILSELYRLSPERLIGAMQAASMALCGVLLLVVLSFYSQNPLTAPLYHAPAEMWFGLPMKHPIMSTFVLLCPLSVLAMSVAQEFHGPRRAALLVGAVTIALSIVLMQRRTGFVAMTGGLAFFVLVVGFRSRWILVAAGALILSGGLFYLLDVGGFASKGSNLRFQIWSEYVGLASNSPVLGHGLSAKPEVVTVMRDAVPVVIAHPHNMLLPTFYYPGLPGLFCLSLIWGRLLWRIVTTRLSAHAAVLCAPLVPGIIALQFDGAFPLVPYHSNWMVLWLPIILAAIGLARESEKT